MVKEDGSERFRPFFVPPGKGMAGRKPSRPENNRKREKKESAFLLDRKESLVDVNLHYVGFRFGLYSGFVV